jgi:hypothetical protein
MMISSLHSFRTQRTERIQQYDVSPSATWNLRNPTFTQNGIVIRIAGTALVFPRVNTLNVAGGGERRIRLNW